MITLTADQAYFLALIDSDDLDMFDSVFGSDYLLHYDSFDGFGPIFL